MAIKPIPLDGDGRQQRIVANANWLENQSASGTKDIPIQFVSHLSPTSPVYRLVKPDGIPDPPSNAVEFTASGSVLIPHFIGLNLLIDFTIDFWAFLDPAGVNTYILTKISSPGSNAFRVEQIVTGLQIDTGGISTNITANIGAWNHIVLAYDQSLSGLDVYINSALQTTISFSFPLNTNQWTLGARFPVQNQPWTGLIDELKLIGAHYSQADVDNSYNSGAGLPGTPSTPNLINGYHFDDNLFDYSGNFNVATSVGTTGFTTGKVGDPLGGTGIFGFVLENGKDQELPFIINVPDGFVGEICLLNAIAYILEALGGNVDFTIYWTWTDLNSEMLTPIIDNKSYALTVLQGNAVVSTNQDPVIMTKVGASGNGLIMGLFRRNGTTDSYGGDICIPSLIAKFIYD